MNVSKAQVLGYLGALQAEALKEAQQIAGDEAGKGNRLQSIYAATSDGSVHVQVAQQAQAAATFVAAWGPEEAEVSLATSVPNGWNTQNEGVGDGVH